MKGPKIQENCAPLIRRPPAQRGLRGPKLRHWHKKDMISKSITNDCFFWNVSNEVLIRIEGASYASNKEKHNDYLWFHPYVAKKRFINLYSTGKFD